MRRVWGDMEETLTEAVHTLKILGLRVVEGITLEELNEERLVLRSPF